MLDSFITIALGTQLAFDSLSSSFKQKDAFTKQVEYTYEVDKRVLEEELRRNKRKTEIGETGFQTVSEYEEKSRTTDKSQVDVPNPDSPQDSVMEYVPQITYEIVRYNNPPGNPELDLARKLKYDRQLNAQGIASSDFKFMVYPAVYYYADSDSTACELFVVPLDEGLTNVEKLKKANIVKKDRTPIMTTEKDINNPYTLRTLTPIDFSKDNKKLIAKEKLGNKFDGIWKTNLWVYDFETKTAKNLEELRIAIVNYWRENGPVNLNDKRWDIYPLGFDISNDNRVVVTAYAYTGAEPVFIGAWSIDVQGVEPKLISLTQALQPVSIVGYKLKKSGVRPYVDVKEEVERAQKEEKSSKKLSEKKLKEELKKKELEYKRKMSQLEYEYKLKLYNYSNQIKDID